MKKKQPLMKPLKLKEQFVRIFIPSAENYHYCIGRINRSELADPHYSLSIVGIGITIFVYGLVALIVRADDFGLYLIKKGGVAKSIGNAILVIMPKFMRSLSFIGTLAMFLVGGGIFVHNVGFIHHLLADYQLANGLLGNVATLVVGVIVGSIACAIVLPAMKLFGKH